MTFGVRPSPRKQPPHLLLAVSSHGFGHLSQAAPVVNQLRKLIPDLRLTVRAAFPESQIKKRIFNPDVLQPVADDFGMIMRDALTIDLSASLKAYEAFHASMPDNINRLAQDLMNQQVDLVLSDIPYLTLAAAQKAGIPSVALCCLNWADILEFALTQLQPDDSAIQTNQDLTLESGQRIVDAIRSIYRKADHFLLPAPSMPMTTLGNTIEIGPVCDPGMNQRATLASRINNQIEQNDESWLVLVGMGGMPFELNPKNWPTHLSGKPIHYIVADQVAEQYARGPAQLLGQSPSLFAETQTGLSYSDLVASVDLIITKPGYGMFAEAAAAGVPVLYVERLNWPETEALTGWLKAVAHCAEISTETLHRGDLGQYMQHLLQLGRYTPVPPSGNLQAATLLAGYLRVTK